MKLAGNHTFRKCFTYAWLLKICVVCFYFGYRNAANESKYNSAIITDTATNCATPIEISDTLRQQIDARVKKELSRSRTESYTGKLFPDTTKEYAVGALRVPRDVTLCLCVLSAKIKRGRVGKCPRRRQRQPQINDHGGGRHFDFDSYPTKITPT